MNEQEANRLLDQLAAKEIEEYLVKRGFSRFPSMFSKTSRF